MYKLLFCFWLLISLSSLRAQTNGPTNTKELQDLLDPVFDRQLKSGGFKTAAIVIVKRDEPLLLAGYGSDPETHVPADPKTTIFRAASISKLFVATAVMQLAERGQLKLDEDVNHYFRRFQLRPAQSLPVTAANLLTHTSGLENWFLGSLVRSPADLILLGEYYARRPPRTFRVPGTELTYSNQGMALAGYLVEAVSNQPFSEYVASNIFEPLGMHHSTFDQRSGPSFNPYPAATLTSTVADMGEFLRMQLNGGSVRGQQVLRLETVADMQRQHWTAHADAPGVTYGFFESHWNGERLLFHTGDSGDHSVLLLSPQRGWGCYAVYRGGNQSTESVREELTATLMNHYYPSTPFALPKPASAVQDLRKFTGLYRSSSVNPYTLEKVLGMVKQVRIQTLPDGSLQLREFAARAIQTKPNLFRTDGGGYLAFRADPDGHIVGGTITGSIWDPQSFDRIAWWEDRSLHRALLAICTLLLFSRLFVGLADLVRRRRSKTPPPKNRGQPLSIVGWRLSGFLPLFVVAGLLSLAANLLVWRPPIIGVPPGGFVLLACLTIASAIAVTLPVFATITWVQSALGLARRIYFSVIAAAALLFAAILFYWNLIEFHV